MSAFYRFKLGDFDCACISDGGVNYPVAGFFKDLPPERAEAILREHGLPTTHVYTPYTLLYVDTGTHKALIDTGIGRYGSTVKQMWPQVDNSKLTAGIYLESLRQAGIHPEVIDTVIITHAHPDHIGGNLNAEAALNLPNAQYFITETEWDFWFSDEQCATVPSFFVDVARENLNPLQEQIAFIQAGQDIVPGICSLAAPGHTPGHIALSIVSGGEVLLHISDTVIHPVHLLYPDTLLAFDMLPEQTLASKRRICNQAADSGALVFAHHFPPYPNLGHIVQQGEHWDWHPF